MLGNLNGWVSVSVLKEGCVSSRILWVKFKFSKVQVCVVAVYGPTEVEIEERERFWNDLDRVVDRVGNGYRLCVLEDMNGWVGERLRVGENYNGKRGIDFCAERDLSVSNTYFEHSSCISTPGWLETKMEWS